MLVIFVKDEEVMALPSEPLERILRKAHVPREVDAAAEAHEGLKQAARKRAPGSKLVEPFAALLENTFNAAGAVRQLELEVFRGHARRARERHLEVVGPVASPLLPNASQFCVT
ncbi:hypothetical protein PPROV_000970500 [Pycnococcus provasolii]|uniref:Uncharacterized protein n=1 Tax=Pycnococcus provasolii TaxID=41880 RepID=A0A830HW68_9CHLO|nr:hypothetical protein PPROV_000970500 [Pycnococcus provasolii]|mmetsp:Transcript_5727/g.14922  ORF Transcript_5727/g.14922 Transcript_5727/m.14922 type:complete len:114 (+) Transcript_5727:113-454(+)